MNCRQHGAFVLFIDDPLDLRIQEFELKVGDHGPSAAKARDDTGIFEGIAEQPDDANERGFKGEIDPGLGHCRAVWRTGFAGELRRLCAEVAGKGDQGEVGVRRAREDERVVIAGDGEARPGILPRQERSR